MPNNILSYEIIDGVAIVTIDSPPVNALGHDVRLAIQEGFKRGAEDASVSAILLICSGGTFFAGADIAEFATGMKDPTLPTLLDWFDTIDKITIAAIHGTALGGGLETALHCHYRIAAPSAKMGLPEVSLGILPGAGGTQRLPRLVGPEAALDMMINGKPISAKQALAAGMIDMLSGEDNLKADALAYAQKLIAENAPVRRVRDKDDVITSFKGNDAFFDEYAKKNARAFRGFKAPGEIVVAVKAAVNLPYDEGVQKEREGFLRLAASPESQAQIHVFFAERATSKVPGIDRNTPARIIQKVGVIGAGTMGGGITMNYLQAGFPVVLVEREQAALDRGLSVIRKNYEISASKGRLTSEQVEAYMALIEPGLDMETLADCDLVIEAVFEEINLKKNVFAQLDKICKAGAILASNTSFLDLNEIADSTSRPQDVIGLHFFSPANVMPLLEIVRGAKTGDDVLSTALKMAKTIRKTPVVAGVCHGFIANRAMEPYMKEAQMLALEGAPLQQIDAVIYDYGFAMGPLSMLDLVGLDVIGRESKERSVMGELVKIDRLGQKKNGGFYDYDDKRTPSSSPISTKLIKDMAAELNVKHQDHGDAAILQRLLYPVVNEGAKIVEEAIALRPSDVDMALIMGYGWPTHKGGPMQWADHVGLDVIVAKLREFEAAYGARFAPAKLLVDMAESGQKFSNMKG